MVRLTVLNDIHLKPTYDTVIDEFELPANTDAVLITGDLIDQVDEDSITQARQLLSRLEEAAVPTVVVPGNHDPRDSAERFVTGFRYVQLAHDRLVSGTEYPVDTLFDTLAVAGWGCTQFDAGCELSYAAATAFEIRDDYGYVDQYAEQQAVQELLAAIDALLAEETTSHEVVEEFGLPSAASTAVESVVTVGTRLIELLQQSSPVLLATHVPPFGTDLDRHHSAEQREMDGLHNGSLAVAGAIRAADPAIACFGHSHVQGYRMYETASTHLLNGGFRGVTTIDLSADGFGYAFHEPDWLPGS